MRPHVEVIHEDDYVWHAAELAGGEGRAVERRLSVDEEDGSSSLRVDFRTGWGRGPGIHHATTEFYVLDGSMTYGGRRLGAGGYLYLPKGCRPTRSRSRRAPGCCTTGSTAMPGSTRWTAWTRPAGTAPART